MAVAIFIGVVGYSLSKNGVMAELKGSASETIIIQVATLLSQHGFLAIVGAGITLAGILACTMSTADSQLLAASSAVSENLLKGMFGVNLTEKRTIHVARATVLFIAVIAVFWREIRTAPYLESCPLRGLDLALYSDRWSLRHYSGNVPTGTVLLSA